MKQNCLIPRMPFYFVRHGQIDWNKTQQTLCHQDDIPLNETGVSQAHEVSKHLNTLGITAIYASPLERAHQTAHIINNYLNLSLELHAGLREISDQKIIETLIEILKPSHTTLIVSHGEVYRVLIRVLNIQTTDLKPKNGGLYFFNYSSAHDQWNAEEYKKGIL